MVQNELQEFFMEEASEVFDNINSILLKNEELGTLSKEEIDSVFRDMHTIKGGSGSVELEHCAKYMHYLENFMDSCRSGDVTLSSEILDFLIDGVSKVQEILNEEFNGTLDNELFESDLIQMVELVEKYTWNKTEPKSIEADKQINNSIDAKDMDDEDVFEIKAIFESLFESIERIENSGEFSYSCLQEQFRYIHTLKGSTQFLELSFLPVYAHALESFLDDVREGNVDLDIELSNFLRDGFRELEVLFEAELNGTITDEIFESKLTFLEKKIQNYSKEELAFEIFEPSTSKDTASVGFELFNVSSKPKEVKKEGSSSAGFELFALPSKKELPKQKIKEVIQKEPEVEVKKEIPKEVTKTTEVVEKKQVAKKAATASSIRVNLDKIDALMNRVSDLVITKSMLFQFADTITDDILKKEMLEKLSDLDRDIRELQDSVMSVRMVPMENVYSRLPKMVRDLAKKLDKKVKFEHIGDTVEIDKMMVEGLMDPLTHIIRNSLDHGIEIPEVRSKKSKPEAGKLTISAAQESGNVIISIMDDGAGINVEKVVEKALEKNIITHAQLEKMSHEEKLMLVFSPGLSTAESVTSVSGRGVGTDVVMSNINSLGGMIKVKSTKDMGSQFDLILPLTLAILDGLNVNIGDRKFILPLNTVLESLQPKKHMIKMIGKEEKEMLMLRREFIPIIRLHSFFGIESKYTDIQKGILIVVKSTTSKMALFVDEFLHQEQIVVKSMETNYRKTLGIGAATIRGDGSIGLILDPQSIYENIVNNGGV